MSTKEEIRDALFNTENVVTGQTDHGYSELADVKEAKRQQAT